MALLSISKPTVAPPGKARAREAALGRLPARATGTGLRYALCASTARARSKVARPSPRAPTNPIRHDPTTPIIIPRVRVARDDPARGRRPGRLYSPRSGSVPMVELARAVFVAHHIGRTRHERVCGLFPGRRRRGGQTLAPKWSWENLPFARALGSSRRRRQPALPPSDVPYFKTRRRGPLRQRGSDSQPASSA